MAVKDQNKGKAFKSHPTIQLARHLAEITSQIPPCVSSHAISHPTDPPARTSDVIPPPSILGVHSPCTSQPTNPDAECSLDMASEKTTSVRKKFVRQQVMPFILHSVNLIDLGYPPPQL